MNLRQSKPYRWLQSGALDLLRRRLRPVFVLSTGRCGTQTLAHLLAASQDILAHHEPKPYLLAATRRAYELDAPAGTFADSFTRAYLHARLFTEPRTHAMRRALRSGAVYAECSNRLTYAAADLARYLPRSKFIFLHRDPLAVVRSGMRRGYYAGHAWDPHRIAPRPGTDAARQWETWDPFMRICWYWSAVNEQALDFMRTLPPARGFTLSSTELFDPSSERIPALFAWCGVPPPPADRVQAVLARPLNAQQHGDFPPPEDWSAERRAELVAIAGPTLRALGYRVEP